MDDEQKNALIEVSVMESKISQKANTNLGITQDYNKENRDRLWDSTKRKNDYKNKMFGEKETYEDKISGKTLHKSQTAAQNKYHMKNKDGENISTKWAEHSAETDHITSLKDAHDFAKHNPFLSDDDFKEVMNCDENYRLLSKSINTSKGEKNDFQLVFDKNNGLSTEARTQIAKEKIKSDIALQGKFAAQTAKNVWTEFANGAKDTLVNSAIPLTSEAVRKMIQVAQGQETMEEAAKDMGKIMVDVAVEGGTNKVIVTALTNTMANSKYKVLQNIANSNEVGKLIALASIVKESAVKYVNGEIDGQEFIAEVGEKGATMAAGLIGGAVGKEIGGLVGLSVGLMAGPVGASVGFVAGEIIGEILGTIITTVACSAIVSFYHASKRLDDYKLKENQIRRLEVAAIKEMGEQRERFNRIVSRENKRLESEIQEGFDMILSNACKETYNTEGVTEGLDKILKVFGKQVAFRSLEDYEAQLDETLKFNF